MAIAKTQINSARFLAANQGIDEVNAQDPNTENGLPAALLYSQRMSCTLLEFDLEANELLQLAVRGQHIKRWSIPRDQYPMNRKGYLAWRSMLKQMHANLMRDILTTHGYTQKECDRVSDIILKKAYKKDSVVQTLEDVVCLVFLNYYFDEFLSRHDDDEAKIISILRKTWSKMSLKGQQAALQLKLSDQASEMIDKAL
ncbi:MAG: DUF4202 domain-containing protein [Bacteroidota bacterium]